MLQPTMPPPMTTTAASLRMVGYGTPPRAAPVPRVAGEGPFTAGRAFAKDRLGEDVLEDPPVDAARIQVCQATEGRHQVDGPSVPDFGARADPGTSHQHRDA